MKLSKNTLLRYGAVLIAGLAIGYSLMPEKIKTKTVIKYIEVETEKRDEIEDKETIITEHPDGTKTTRIISKKRSQIENTRVTESKHEESKEKVTGHESQWSAGLYYSVSPLSGIPAYNLTVDRRIIGNLYVGLYGRVDESFQNEIGVGLRYNF